jgi:TetR/AcrR family transcriptional regulator, cholesterol catabolism regulator
MEQPDLKTKIIETAEKLFLTYGFRSITMDEVAKELGISKKTIYQFFTDKNELVEVVTVRYMEEKRKKISEIMTVAKDSIDELMMVSEQMIQNFSSINPVAMLDLQKYHANAWKAFLKFKQDFFLTMIKESLEKGIANGFFRAEINPTILSRMRFEQIQLAFNQEIYPAQEFNFIQLQQHLMEHFVHGILSEKGRQLYQRYLSKSNKHNFQS